MELGDLVPLLTTAGALGELRLRGAGIDVLESSRHASRKVALVAVLHADAENDATQERGLFLSPKSVNVQEQDTAVLLCTLRGVDLRAEPVWGSLLLLVASHAFVAASGAIGPESFRALSFLAHFRTAWRVVEGDDDQQNNTLLKELVPRTTWVAIDLKIKEMEGLETPTKYFEHKLANPPVHGVSVEDAELQMLANELLPPTMRDCLSIKSTTLTTPAGFTTPQAFTSSKIFPHALDTIQAKALFGRYLSGGVMLHLLRSLAHSIASNATIVLQRVVYNVQLNYWKLLLESAYEKYTDEIHARLSVYEKIEFNADYIVTITENKMQSEKVSVVNAGQGQFSSFDEFGNLKRSVSQGSSSQNLLKDDGVAERPTLNTGIFSFIKNRAGRAFSKQFSGLTSSSSTTSNSSAVTSLNHIPEDDDAENDDLAPVNLETPEDVLNKYNARIASYQVPMEYINTPTEAMPVSETTLESIHQNALNEAKKLILPFIYDLRCTEVKYSEFTSAGLDLSVGKRNFLRRVGEVKKRFELANEAASSIFCSQLVQYLHTIVLKKNEKDNEAQKNSIPRVARSTSAVIMPDSGDKNAAPLTRLPMELLTYKNNLEAMVSQYNFVSRGPMASRVLIGFYQAVVRKRLLALAQREYNRFGDACDAKESKLADIEDSLENTQELVLRHQKTNEEYTIMEAKSIAAIELKHKDEIAGLEEAIQRANEKLEQAMRDQRALYQRTMQATRKTINTIDKVAEKNRVFMGYLERFEKGHLFSKSWRQYYYVLDHSTLKCYKSKGAFEERSPPMEKPITLTGYNVIKSRTDEMKMKLIPPEAGQMLRFRAPASVGRDTWMKKFIEAAQPGR